MYATTSTFQVAVTYNAPGQTTGVEWPNAQSRANSDPWIAQHHAEITVMKPRILALNFVNTKSMEQMRAQLEATIAEANVSAVRSAATCGSPVRRWK